GRGADGAAAEGDDAGIDDVVAAALDAVAEIPAAVERDGSDGRAAVAEAADGLPAGAGEPAHVVRPDVVVGGGERRRAVDAQPNAGAGGGDALQPGAGDGRARDRRAAQRPAQLRAVEINAGQREAAEHRTIQVLAVQAPAVQRRAVQVLAVQAGA